MYAVRKGRSTGIFTSWSECQKSVKGFPQAQFKKFKSRAQAYLYLNPEEEGPTHNVDTMEAVYLDESSDTLNQVIGAGLYWGDERDISLRFERNQYWKELSDSLAVDLPLTHNVAALLAMDYIVDNIERDTVVYVDSQYLLFVIQNRKPKANRELAERVFKKIDSSPYKVILRKVKAHSGIHGNEMADQLASEAIA